MHPHSQEIDLWEPYFLTKHNITTTKDSTQYLCLSAWFTIQIWCLTFCLVRKLWICGANSSSSSNLFLNGTTTANWWGSVLLLVSFEGTLRVTVSLRVVACFLVTSIDKEATLVAFKDFIDSLFETLLLWQFLFEPPSLQSHTHFSPLASCNWSHRNQTFIVSKITPANNSNLTPRQRDSLALILCSWIFSPRANSLYHRRGHTWLFSPSWL